MKTELKELKTGDRVMRGPDWSWDQYTKEVFGVVINCVDDRVGVKFKDCVLICIYSDHRREIVPVDEYTKNSQQSGNKTELFNRIKNDFTHHQPTPDMLPKFKAIRESGLNLAGLLVESCPVGRELSTALTKLEEVVMWANAGIARIHLSVDTTNKS